MLLIRLLIQMIIDYYDLKAKFAKDDELEMKPWNKNGKHIVVIPPSYWLCKNLGWNPTKVLQDTIDELKKHTDREIRVRVKKEEWSIIIQYLYTKI